MINVPKSRPDLFVYLFILFIWTGKWYFARWDNSTNNEM